MIGSWSPMSIALVLLAGNGRNLGKSKGCDAQAKNHSRQSRDTDGDKQSDFVGRNARSNARRDRMGLSHAVISHQLTVAPDLGESRPSTPPDGP